jgi:hypothetical protein
MLTTILIAVGLYLFIGYLLVVRDEERRARMLRKLFSPVPDWRSDSMGRSTEPKPTGEQAGSSRPSAPL